jgi:hypothetical protein
VKPCGRIVQSLGIERGDLDAANTHGLHLLQLEEQFGLGDRGPKPPPPHHDPGIVWWMRKRSSITRQIRLSKQWITSQHSCQTQ